jgi:hypothetical protein
MFFETEIFDYRLSFADQGKKPSVFCFHLQQTNGSLLFPFFRLLIVQREVCRLSIC